MIAVPVLAALLAGCTGPEEEATHTAPTSPPVPPTADCIRPGREQYQELNLRFQYSFHVFDESGYGMSGRLFEWTDARSRLAGVRLNISWDEGPLAADFVQAGVWNPGETRPYRGLFLGDSPLVVNYSVDRRDVESEGMFVNLAPAGDPSLPASAAIVAHDHPVNVTVTQFYRC